MKHLKLFEEYTELETEMVEDYKGRKIKKEDAVWCEIDRVWCLKDESAPFAYTGPLWDGTYVRDKVIWLPPVGFRLTRKEWPDWKNQGTSRSQNQTIRKTTPPKPSYPYKVSKGGPPSWMDEFGSGGPASWMEEFGSGGPD